MGPPTASKHSDQGQLLTRTAARCHSSLRSKTCTCRTISTSILPTRRSGPAQVRSLLAPQLHRCWPRSAASSECVPTTSLPQRCVPTTSLQQSCLSSLLSSMVLALTHLASLSIYRFLKNLYISTETQAKTQGTELHTLTTCFSQGQGDRLGTSSRN